MPALGAPERSNLCGMEKPDTNKPALEGYMCRKPVVNVFDPLAV
jgi:hypothetical protein